MKKVSYIVFGIAFLAFTSCQKEVIVPQGPAHNASDIEWKSADAQEVKEGAQRPSQPKAIVDPATMNSGNGTAATANEGTTDDSGITDPNNDPDAAKKKGKK